MDVRELRYFVAVAEELHFGRAAERLGMAQPPLSRAIRALERRLDTDLLVRGGRGVTLTGPGAVLLAEAGHVLDAVEAAERRTRRSAAPIPGVVLAVKAGASDDLLADLLDAYAGEPGAVQVDVRLCGAGEGARMLRDGRADVALLHQPHDDTDRLDTAQLRSEGQVALVPAGHPLSARDSVTLADIAHEPPPRWRGSDGRFPDGLGPAVEDHHQLVQLVQLVGLGRAVAVLPECCTDRLPAGVRALPVIDAPRVTTVVAWSPTSRSRAAADLVEAALRLTA